MNELIQVADRQIGDSTVQTVNARDLHAFLEVGKDFSTWIKGRIEQYGFIEHHDFVTFDAAPQNGGAGNRGHRVEYAISLDMAKELAMVERNERGKQARLYFIECERRAKANVIDISTALSDPAKLRNALLAYTERVMALEAKVQEQAPKAKFHDAVAEAINCQSIQEVAKVLGTGPNRLFKFLRDEGLLMHNNLPYQHHLDAGYFRVVEKQYNDERGESHTYTRTLVTGKGLAYIQKRLQSQANFMRHATA
jgi:anti-repressor protein